MRAGAWLAAATLLSACGAVQAASAPDECVITIVSVELKDNTGRWFELVRPDRQVDLAAETPRITFFNNGRRIPPGSYINFRITISESFGIQGADGGRYTSEGGRAVLRGDAETGADLPGRLTGWTQSAPTLSTVARGRMTQRVDLDGGDEDDVIQIRKRVDLAQPLVIREGSFVGVWFDFDLEETLRYAWPDSLAVGVPREDAMCFLPPAAPRDVTITVDQQTVRIPGDMTLLEF